MNRRLWAKVFDDHAKTWYIDQKTCDICRKRMSRTLYLVNTRDSFYSSRDAIGIEPSACNLCKDCLLTTTFEERASIFAHLAVRRKVVSRDCLICKKTTKRYILIVNGGKTRYVCFDCFVSGNVKTFIRYTH